MSFLQRSELYYASSSMYFWRYGHFKLILLSWFIILFIKPNLTLNNFTQNYVLFVYR